VSGDGPALAIAAIGVVGTLASAVVTQWIATRTRREDLQEERHRQQVEQAQSSTQTSLKERQACYVALNSATRQYVTAINQHLHHLQLGAITYGQLHELDHAKGEHRDRYSEAQMIVGDRVLRAASEANQALSSAYGVARRLERDRGESGEALEAALADVDNLWALVGGMRAVMREDLGVSAEPSSGTASVAT